MCTQELFNEYQWRQQSYTNYARQKYQRYVSTTQEGFYFYDLYGNYITRGQLIYDWRVSAPQTAEVIFFKTTNFGSWFSKCSYRFGSEGPVCLRSYHWRSDSYYANANDFLKTHVCGYSVGFGY